MKYKNIKFDRLNWLTEKGIGKIWHKKIFNLHISIHVAKCKDGKWK